MTCDICGTATDRNEAKSSRALLLDGTQYTIDLCATHTMELDAVVAPFVAAARRAGPGPSRPARRRSQSSSPSRQGRAGRQNMSTVREWARANGFSGIAGRGRVPRDVLEAYQAAHGQDTPAPPRPARRGRRASA